MARGGSSGRRTYARDANGRFASTGTTRSRPAPKKAATRGTNRLTRDNSGRITGQGGTGVTARGGRLRTAAGNLRATQTARLPKVRAVSYGSKAPTAAAAPSRSKRSPATSKLKPGELMNANARPRNLFSKPPKYKDPYETEGNWWKFNVETAALEAEKRGSKVGPFTSTLGEIMNAPGAYSRDTRQVSFNRKAEGYWRDPAMVTRMNRYLGDSSTSNPIHTVLHEVGHSKDRGDRGAAWRGPAPKVASRVSKYATTNRAEFVAEVYAGINSGIKYDYQVMRAYREAMGLSPAPAARRRSRVRRRGATP